MQNHFKNELHNVLSGKSEIRFGAVIQAIASYLNDGAQTSGNLEIEKHFKKQETKRLEDYISTNKLWVEVDLSQYVKAKVRSKKPRVKSEERKVFRVVRKVNLYS